VLSLEFVGRGNTTDNSRLPRTALVTRDLDA